MSPNHTLLFVVCLGSVQMSRASHRESPSKFPTKLILGYPPHLKYVAALP